MAKKRFYLVKYTIVHGEYEDRGQTVISVNPRAKIEAAVHRYFLDFYGSDNEGKSYSGSDTEKLKWYTYNCGDVAVKKIYWQEITEEQLAVLAELNIA